MTTVPQRRRDAERSTKLTPRLCVSAAAVVTIYIHIDVVGAGRQPGHGDDDGSFEAIVQIPFISRRLPGWSMVDVFHALFAVDVTVAPVAAPVSSFRASGVVRVAPVALFQFVVATTPALSATPIATALPTKSMPIARPALGVPTTSVTVVLWLSAPLVPMMVSVELPDGVVADVVTFSVELPEAVTDAGTKIAVLSGGSPVNPRLTVPANPFVAPMSTV